jgi:hypothetical protein
MARAFLSAITALLLLSAPARARDAAAMTAEVVALATAPDTLTLDPDTALQRLAFRGGNPKREEVEGGVGYWLKDGFRTFGHVVLAKTSAGWRVKILYLAFEDSDNLLLKSLSEPLTKAFGTPSDQTTGNTVLLWSGRDRYVRVMADVPGAAEELRVYVVMVVPR